MRKKINQNKNLKPHYLEEQRQDTKIKMFVQMLNIKSDTNMTRIYCAMQPIKNA
jgi:hypothetical protein